MKLKNSQKKLKISEQNCIIFNIKNQKKPNKNRINE